MTEKPESKLPRLYFNEYIAGSLRSRQDFEAINTDLLYFCLLMKSNQYAKEVYFLRKASRPDVDVIAVYTHLAIMRKFILDFYEIEPPNLKLIQNELEDPLEELDKLPLDGTESKAKNLKDLAKAYSSNPEELSIDAEEPGEASPRAEHSQRQSSVEDL